MRSSISVACAACVLITIALGCGDPPHLGGDVTSTFTIDLSSLRMHDEEGRQTECLSVLDEAVLRADRQEVGRQSFEPGEFSVIFEDVTVDVGEVTFDVSIWSTADVLLYSGDTTRVIERDGFQVAIQPEAQDAVLVVCPSSTTLSRLNNYSDSISVSNRGSDTLSVRVSDEGRRCDSFPCLWIENDRVTLAPGTSTPVWFGNDGGWEGDDSLTVASRVGSLTIPVSTATLP